MADSQEFESVSNNARAACTRDNTTTEMSELEFSWKRSVAHVDEMCHLKDESWALS